MSSISTVNPNNWLASAWSAIQSSSSSTGVAILDALTGKSTLSDGLSIADGQALASTLATAQQNFLEQQNVIAGQRALARVQKSLAPKPVDTPLVTYSAVTGNKINVTA